MSKSNRGFASMSLKKELQLRKLVELLLTKRELHIHILMKKQ